MGENKILDEVGVMGGNQILDEVGEWGEVDIVEDKKREERDKVGEGGEGKMGENHMFWGFDRQWTKSTHPCRLSAVSRGQ